MPLRLSALAVVCALVFLGPVLADEFTTRITKIDGDQVTFQKKKKGGKDGKATDTTLTAAKDVKVFKGRYDADAKAVLTQGKADPDGLRSKLLLSAEGGKLPEGGVSAVITTEGQGDATRITKIVVTQPKSSKGQ